MPIGELGQAIRGRLIDLASRTNDDYKSLNRVVSEILKDEGLALFLADNTKKGEGLLLGTFFYAAGSPDGYYVDYGLSIDHEADTLRAALFVFQHSRGVCDAQFYPILRQGFPERFLEKPYNDGSEPSFPKLPPKPKDFIRRVVEALKEPNNHLFDYAKAERYYHHRQIVRGEPPDSESRF